jgi:hypothetical protein
MQPRCALLWVLLSLPLTSSAWTATGPVFYGDPPDNHHPWAVHDRNRPEPKRVVPGTFSAQAQPGRPPSDAVILFDGTSLAQWQSDNGGDAPWQIINGAMQVVPDSGGIRTRERFGDCQLHIEWAAPAQVESSGQGRGNSGVFLMGRLEIQVLDSYNNSTYADGHAGSYYGVNPPLALPLNPPGEWQVYDIIFRRPVYRDGQLIDPGYVTVFLNGVLVQDHTPIEGPTGHMGRVRPGPFPARGPLSLQDHGNTTRFRNIWYRELPPRATEGGTDGFLTQEAATTKRREIADSIRQRAQSLQDPANPLPQLLLLLESLQYDSHEPTRQQVERTTADYVNTLVTLPADQQARRKDDAKQLHQALEFLVKFNNLPAAFPPRTALDQLIRSLGWDK